MFKGLLVAGLIVAAMVAIKDGRALRRSGILSSCTSVAAPVGANGYWAACRPGKLEGRPNLRHNSCTSQGVVGRIEYWRCPSPLGRGPYG